ncbi:hypothetical protein Q5P01_010150 [Channa striata]|uniref:Uncharacterized protein n=1 Tax=Channa striata TaxID=64152 RepID=A0AA88SVC4_CHASR|nr:hypothetical protein Q5P01_010150 [Channa striata]
MPLNGEQHQRDEDEHERQPSKRIEASPHGKGSADDSVELPFFVLYCSSSLPVTELLQHMKFPPGNEKVPRVPSPAH